MKNVKSMVTTDRICQVSQIKHKTRKNEQNNDKIKMLYSTIVHYIIKHTDIVNTNFKKVCKSQSQGNKAIL